MSRLYDIDRKTKLDTEEEPTSYLNRGWQLTKELRSGKMLKLTAG
jgi:hypothetical protein